MEKHWCVSDIEPLGQPKKPLNLWTFFSSASTFGDLHSGAWKHSLGNNVTVHIGLTTAVLSAVCVSSDTWNATNNSFKCSSGVTQSGISAPSAFQHSPQTCLPWAQTERLLSYPPEHLQLLRCFHSKRHKVDSPIQVLLTRPNPA